MRALREQQVEAQRLIEATHSALEQDGELLSERERADVQTLLSKTSELASGDDADAIRHAIEALALGTESFAARRMDQAIGRALSGRRIDELGH